MFSNKYSGETQMSEIKKSTGKKIPPLKVLIPTIIVVLFISWVVYFTIDFGRGFEPQVFTGEDARAGVQNFFIIPVPQSADRFYYRHEGFQDDFYNVGMNIPAKDAWPFLIQYTGRKKTAFKAMKDKDSFGFKDPGLWDISEMKSPLIYNIKGKDSILNIIYDEETGRLLVSVSSW